MTIKVKLQPNQETDYQSFDLDDLGLTEDEWNAMSEDSKCKLLNEVVQNNIYGMITEITTR
ncbi:MAG: hypothetical protein ACI9N9_000089 [Enterobacterales bacterium]|jgi:hypothetical protein